MQLHSDSVILLQAGPFPVNLTLACTWVVMGLLAIVSWRVTRRLSVEAPSRRQLVLEAIVEALNGQIREILDEDPRPFLPFLGSLFLFLSLSSFLVVVPGFRPPTASLSTTAALALWVFVAVPSYGVARHGLLGFLKQYLSPTPLMFPFNVLSEVTRTVALAVRLFGNMMSGVVMGALILSLAPFLFPLLMQAFELLIGQVQAYIFAVLATVYIASAVRARGPGGRKGGPPK